MAPITSPLKVHFRRDRSITQLMLENICNTDPGKVICEDTLSDKRLTYGGVREDAFRLAESLRRAYGLQPGDVVSIISRSCVDYILATHAVWAAGATVSTINHSNTTKDIAFAIGIVKPKIIIVDAAVKKKVDDAVKQDQFQITILTLLSRVPGHALFPDELLLDPGARISPEAYVLDGQDAHKRCAAIVLSSGTTGLPKAVMLSHYNLTAICEMLRLHDRNNWRGDMREVFFPVSTYGEFTYFAYVSHIYGMYVCALLGPWLGCYIQLMHAFDMGIFCQAHVASKLRERFPGVSLCQTYGCTETSSCITQSGVRDRDAPLVATGTLVANMAIRFIDDSLQEVAPGTPGEICVSCPTIMMGYKDNEKATQESFLEPGWYRTGDVGYLDKNGYLIIVDRIKDVIKYKGFQVPPSELEEIIGRHPHVHDVGVVAAWADAEATELPRAFVVADPALAVSAYPRLADEICKLVADQVAGYKRLRGGVRFVQRLPRNPTGKLLRRQLRVEQERGESAGGQLKGKI
ncbi:uncharacterized protein PV07_05103 [Cladophialophora immunda]|uniref:4-coumarate-CoA ligase n=1 Tax=Cladophialophora immunda TaxID=569365 RepID=A0A0D2CDP5_9EURO|nr:uncharacterized protein PV07_05103 [Cladophialophora immunda]KIW29278.1 hypothetical protein PV07_05103 [Cladophialophora immunda]